MTKVLITDYVHPTLLTNLIQEGFIVDYLPEIDLEEVRKILAEYDAVVINTKTPLDKTILVQAINLKLIVRLGSGLEIIDLDYAQKKDIKVINTPQGNRNAVAEHALGLLLNLTNHITESFQEVKSMKWNREKNRGIELEGKTIGIIGFGNTGSAFAKILSGFDVKILAFDKYRQRFASDYRNVEEVDMETIFENVDILSFHIPLTEETKYIGNNVFFEKFKKNFFLINTSRGKIVNTDHLIEGLESGKILGAGLDVLENEKLDFYSTLERKLYFKLFNLNNVIVTPHIAGWTHESFRKISDLTYKSICQFFENYKKVREI